MRHPFCKLCERLHHSECRRDDIDLNPACAKILAHGHYPLNLGYTCITLPAPDSTHYRCRTLCRTSCVCIARTMVYTGSSCLLMRSTRQPVAGHVSRAGGGAMSRAYFKGEREEQRAYSRAVKVRGGTTVYLAGIGAPVDAQGHSLAGNFTAQTHQVFARLRETMALVGGTLDDMVTMTVFITDPRYGDEFVEIRKQYFTRA